MSVTFLDSFDNYLTTTTAVLGKWQAINDAVGSLSIQPGLGRNATDAFQTNMGGSILQSPGAYMQWSTTNRTRTIIGLAIKVTQFDGSLGWGVLSWMDGSQEQVTLVVLANGRLQLNSGANYGGTQLAQSAAPVIAATGVYYYVELDTTFNTATGATTCRVNGVQAFTATNINTCPSGNNLTSALRMGIIGSHFSVNNPFNLQTHGLIDDLYIIDPTVGAHNTSFLGDTRVFCAFPTSDGAPLNFTPSPNQSHYLNVNQVEQDGDTTYNFDATATDIDVYGHTPTPANTGTIFAVQLCQISRKDSAAARSTANYLKSGGSTTQGATQALSQSYAWYLDIVEVDPATTVAFTKAGFDATLIGVTVAA